MVKEIEDAIQEVHKVREKGTVDEVKAAMEKLERASHRAAEELYKTAAPGGDAGQGPGPGAPAAPGGEEKKKDNVVDAEFKQV
jgi:molecular chaperone DnaK